MEYEPPPAFAPRKPPVERLLALFEVLLLSGLVSSSVAVLPFSFFGGKAVSALTADVKTVCAFLLLESAVTLMLLAAVLRFHGETIRDLGLRRHRWKRNFVTGLLLVPFLFLVNAGVALGFRKFLPEYYVEKNPLTEIIQSPEQLAFFIVSALIAGGIKEELQRAFILVRFGRYLGGAALGLLVWSLAFGAGHYVQGVQGITVAAIYGFVFGAMYLLSGSLIAPIVAHGAYDAAALLLYWFTAGRFK
jgi:membrane protease YdiL (CAAX protease family)